MGLAMVPYLEAQFGLTRPELARVFGVEPRTLERWVTGQTYPQHEARLQLGRLHALDAQLRDVFATETTSQAWLRTDNRYLGGMKPIEALLAGRPDRVVAAVEALESGVFV
jgi:transcriptional regulator with XRE-family HTH domain